MPKFAANLTVAHLEKARAAVHGCVRELDANYTNLVSPFPGQTPTSIASGINRAIGAK